MACFHPLDAWQLEDGRVVFVERGNVLRSLQLPCGQCIGCRQERARQWAVRCVHEASLHRDNVFVTLTYSDKEIRSESLVYRDFQLFMKRLRKYNVRRLRAEGVALPKKASRHLPFYMAGEYGEEFARPHFHAILFGVFFPDRVYLKKAPSGERLYRSLVLERLWPHGFSSIGDVTMQSCAYVARYVVKKVTGRNAAEHYGEVCDPVTGEISPKVPEFSRMSLRPAIGAKWFERYGAEVFPRDAVVLEGRQMPPPAYYDKLLATLVFDVVEWRWVPLFEVAMASVEFSRFVKAAEREYDNTRERLAVREVVQKARLSFNKRSLK